MDELERKSVAEMKAGEKHPVILILDDVRSMHNVGSTFRTGDAFAVESIFLCGYTPQPPHRDIHKTALGATETVHWQHFTNTIDAVNEARSKGYKVYAIEQAHNSIALQDFSWNTAEPVAFVFGNEVSGVQEAVMELADGCIEIPQWGAKHSLNISVTVGVVLWELMRRH
ncbi:TrmH family RNA methyltransferase [Taibaiella soli]|uniref:TrmH family RNA methyltransferase n=2 Tax=Taibaiella soli TaxID=1649169 RepID=A0A2W2A7K8_9BACT|nr:TrmH family RNA methyltransferase [Taibaiella soli]